MGAYDVSGAVLGLELQGLRVTALDTTQLMFLREVSRNSIIT